MFAYVRLYSLNGRKMFEVAEGERSSILQNARQTEMGTRGTRPSEYQRQRLARTSIDFGRPRWTLGNAKRMNGTARCLSDRNICITCFTYERGSGLEENLHLSSLILAYLRLMGKKFWRALRAATMRNGECREAGEEGSHRPRTCLEPVFKIARSGDRAYRASGFWPFPVGRVPSRGVRRQI